MFSVPDTPGITGTFVYVYEYANAYESPRKRTHFTHTLSVHSYIDSDYVVYVAFCVRSNACARSRQQALPQGALQSLTTSIDPFAATCVQFISIHDDGRGKHHPHKEVMMRIDNTTNRLTANVSKTRIAKATAATGLVAALLTLAGCAYEAPPQPRLPYRGNETTNPAYQPNCGPPPYAAGTPCSPYAAPPSPAPTTDAYGRPYPPTDGYGRPYPSDAQGRPYPPPPPPPAYQETYPANGAGAPTPGSETAH